MEEFGMQAATEPLESALMAEQAQEPAVSPAVNINDLLVQEPAQPAQVSQTTQPTQQAQPHDKTQNEQPVTFTQADVDRIIGNRLYAERQKYQPDAQLSGAFRAMFPGKSDAEIQAAITETMAKEYAAANGVNEAVAKDIYEAKTLRAQQPVQPDGNQNITALAQRILDTKAQRGIDLTAAFSGNPALIDMVSSGRLSVDDAVNMQLYAQPTQQTQPVQPQPAKQPAPAMPLAVRGGERNIKLDITNMSTDQFKAISDALERGEYVQIE